MVDEVKVQFGASTRELEAGANQSAAIVESVANRMRQAFSTLAIEETVRRAFEATARLALESEVLGRTLGVTAGEASILKDALNQISSSGEAYSSAFVHFNRQLRANEDSMNALGLATKDANGHTRDSQAIMQDAFKVIQQYRPGIDQTRAAMFFFGRSVQEVMALQRLTTAQIEESRKGMEAWGLTVNKDGVDSAHNYQKSMSDLGNAMLGIQKIISDALLPVFSAFTTDLSSSASTVIPAVTVAVSILAAGLIGLKQAAEIVWYTFDAVVKVLATFVASMINQVEIAIDTAGKMISKIKGLDWKGAGEAAKTGWQSMKQEAVNASEAASQAWDEDNAKIVSSTEKNVEQLKRLWSGTMKALGTETTDIKAPKIGKDGPSGTGGKTFVDPNETKRIAEIRLGAEHDAVVAAIELERQKAQTLLTLGEITAAAELAIELELNQKKYAADADFLDKLKVLHGTDRVAQAKDAAEALKLKKTNDLTLLKDEDKLLIERRKNWTQFNTDLQNGFQVTITDLLAKGATLKESLTSLWKQIFTGFVDNMVSKPIAEYAAGLIKQTALYKSFQGIMLGQQAAGSAATVATKESEAGTVVAANAAEAGSGAAASQAMIPIIGPALAIAAALAMLAFVRSMKTAAGGFDVPSSINPMTQLHGGEMVLPKDLADKVRGMTSAPALTINIQAWDGRDVKRVLMDHGSAIADSLRAQTRNFRMA
jgi:hypothetical protein